MGSAPTGTRELLKERFQQKGAATGQRGGRMRQVVQAAVAQDRAAQAAGLLAKQSAAGIQGGMELGGQKRPTNT